MQQFKAQKGRPRSDLPAIIHDLGLEPGVLNQQWSELSVSPPSSFTGHSICSAYILFFQKISVYTLQASCGHLKRKGSAG